MQVKIAVLTLNHFWMSSGYQHTDWFVLIHRLPQSVSQLFRFQEMSFSGLGVWVCVLFCFGLGFFFPDLKNILILSDCICCCSILSCLPWFITYFYLLYTSLSAFSSSFIFPSEYEDNFLVFLPTFMNQAQTLFMIVPQRMETLISFAAVESALFV